MADLTTLANVKSYMLISNTASDPTLSRLISAFSQWFLSQVNRGALIQSSYIENRNGTGGDSLTTLQFPIISVEALSIWGAPILPAANAPGYQPGFSFDDYSIYLCGSRFCKGRANIQIQYTAGFPTVPLDIEQAVIDQVTFTFRRQPNLGSISNSMGGQMTAMFSQKDLAPGVAATIKSYKDEAVVGL